MTAKVCVKMSYLALLGISTVIVNIRNYDAIALHCGSLDTGPHNVSGS